MTVHKLLLASSIVVALAATAHAQSSTTGAVQGVVTDSKTGDKLPGVTVVITSPAISQTQTAITDESGFYKITELPPGDYRVTFFYADITIEQQRDRAVGRQEETPAQATQEHRARVAAEHEREVLRTGAGQGLQQLGPVDVPEGEIEQHADKRQRRRLCKKVRCDGLSGER